MGSISDNEFMIYIPNNFLQDYDIFLDTLKNCLIVSRNNVLTVDVICKKLNQWYKKYKSKKEEKNEKENALGACN